MQTLFGMGFLDREKNARLLRKYSNNLVLVIEELLSGKPGIILDENNVEKMEKHCVTCN